MLTGLWVAGRDASVPRAVLLTGHEVVIREEFVSLLTAKYHRFPRPVMLLTRGWDGVLG